MKVCSVEEMRQLDQIAINQCGIPGHILMENAGLGACQVMARERGVRGKRYLVLCGTGHNGGDGLVVARRLFAGGAKVSVFLMGSSSQLDETVAIHHRMLAGCGLAVLEQPTSEQIEAALAKCDAVVDALLGTGITREVGGRFREVIERVNRAGKPVFSLDIPSGVDGNNGQIRGVAIRADATITFGQPKRGNLLYPGAERGGKLFVEPISFPPWLQQTESVQVSLNCPPPLPPRKQDGHKGSFGDVLFVAGAAGYLGAPIFSALALLKAGGGYARLAAPQSVIPFLATIGSEIVFHPQQETQSGSLSLKNAEPLLELSRKTDFVVIGPGLSLADETQELVIHLCGEIEKPLLIDGDGLTAIAQGMDLIRHRTGPTILTPHPKEMSRISGTSIEQIKADPIGILQRTAADLQAIIVLKGAHSLIGTADGQVWINLSGNSGMATAGSGDVLTGAIAAMVGLGLPLPQAVGAGVFLHGLAGDLAARDRGEDGMTARDILEHLPAAVNSYRQERTAVLQACFGPLAEE
ncbi:MAG: NAD(P)H-hydrate dehydratase [Bradymonadales bacterium]|nr:NAD(P)H-hydrate dehydratase [Bradymonadales bacterium]